MFKARAICTIIGVLSLFSSACNPLQSHEALLTTRIATTKPSVVRFVSEHGSCSAFYVGQDLFITAAHCIRPDADHFIENTDGDMYLVQTIITDRDRDVAVFSSNDFDGLPLQLWNEWMYGDLKIGSAIISMGFPGYYGQEFAFEEGTVLDKRMRGRVRMLVSRNAAYFGESGGPVISLHNGQVVGLVHALSEHVTDLGGDIRVHNTLSMLVAWSEIRTVLEQARKVR